MHLFAHLKPGFTFSRPVNYRKVVKSIFSNEEEKEEEEDTGETNHLRHLLSQLIACSTRKSMPRSLERSFHSASRRLSRVAFEERIVGVDEEEKGILKISSKFIKIN